MMEVQRIQRLISKVASLLVMLLILSSCNKENAPDCFQSAGAYKTVERSLDVFSTVELNDYIQYELCDTNYYGVVITSPGNLIPDIETEVNDGKLTIHNRNTCNFVRSFKKKITIRICAPTLLHVLNFSTGDIRTVNPIHVSRFLFENRQAAGLHQLEMDADTVDIKTHTGVCDVILTGNANEVFLFNQGLGILDARTLNASKAFVNNSSINNVYVNANDYLFSFIRSSGSVYYSGSPEIIDADIQGQGRLIPM
jgi:hypothetical protein